MPKIDDIRRAVTKATMADHQPTWAAMSLEDAARLVIHGKVKVINPDVGQIGYMIAKASKVESVHILPCYRGLDYFALLTLEKESP